MKKDPEVRLISLDGNDDAGTILKVSSDAQAILKEEHKINIPMSEAIATIVEVFLQKILDEAGAEARKTGKTTLFNMFDMFELGYNVAEDEDDEKGGNITPAFRPLGMSKTAGKDDESRSDE